MLNVFKDKNSSLHIALRSNAIFSDISGLVMILFAKPLAAFIGLNNPGILVLIGIALFAWAALLFWGSVQEQVPNWLAWLAIDGDLAWILGTAVILLLPNTSLTTTGKWTLAIIADIVLVFAIWQFFGLRKAQRTLNQEILNQGNPLQV